MSLQRTVLTAVAIATAATDGPRLPAQADGPAPAQPPAATPGAAPAALEAARDSVWRAWFAGDTVTLSRLIPAALAAGVGSVWESRADAFASSVRSKESGRRLIELRFDSTKSSLRGDVAVLVARFRYTTEDREHRRASTSGIATEVFVRERGRWVNPFWHLQETR